MTEYARIFCSDCADYTPHKAMIEHDYRCVRCSEKEVVKGQSYRPSKQLDCISPSLPDMAGLPFEEWLCALKPEQWKKIAIMAVSLYENYEGKQNSKEVA